MIARLASRKPRCHEALEGYVAAVGIICPPPTVKRPARNSGAAIAGRSCYSTASSAAALGHLGAVHERGSGAKTARNSLVRHQIASELASFGRHAGLSNPSCV